MKENEIIVYQQKRGIAFLAAIIVLVSSMAVVGVTGNYIGGVYRIINAFFLVASLIAIYFTFFKRGAPLRPIFIAMLLVLELGVCMELVYCAHHITPYFTTLIVANMTILAIILMLSLFSHRPKVSYLLALMTIVTYTYCAYVTNDTHLWGLYVIFVLLFAMGGLFSYYFTKGMNVLIAENDQLKTDKQAVLSAFGIDRVELDSYVELSKANVKGDRKALGILNVMGDGARENLKNSVAYLVEQDKIVYDSIHAFIPEFTKSEVAIAKLIVEGKKGKGIAMILNKKESNITCQRTKMRLKLGLNEKDNLREAILGRIVVEE